MTNTAQTTSAAVTKSEPLLAVSFLTMCATAAEYIRYDNVDQSCLIEGGIAALATYGYYRFAKMNYKLAKEGMKLNSEAAERKKSANPTKLENFMAEANKIIGTVAFGMPIVSHVLLTGIFAYGLVSGTASHMLHNLKDNLLGNEKNKTEQKAEGNIKEITTPVTQAQTARSMTFEQAAYSYR